MITVVCKICEKDFETYPSRIKVGKGKYCSTDCRDKDRKNFPRSTKEMIAWVKANVKRDPKNYKIVPCATCGKKVEKSIWRLSAYKNIYCSNDCQYQSMVVGEYTGDIALHAWIIKRLGQPNKCDKIDCKYPRKNSRGIVVDKPYRYEWANIHGKPYKKDINNFVRLCVNCHRKYDAPINRKTKIKVWKNNKVIEI